MYDTILVPTDGSDVARAAVDNAVAFAERFDADLHIIHVTEPSELPPGIEDSAAGEFAHHGERAVESAAELAIQAGVEIETAVLTPSARTSIHREVLDYAATNDVDCIVMGTHGRRGLDRYLLGSMTEGMVRDSPIPVVSVHEDTVVNPNFGDVLVPTDGSDCANVAADHAIELAATNEATLHVLSVVDGGVIRGDTGTLLKTLESDAERAIEPIVERAEDAGLESVTTSVLNGTPYRAIVDYAAEHTDCVVMGTRGRTGLDHFLLGSVTERVVRLSDVPVCTIRDPRIGDR